MALGVIVLTLFSELAGWF